MRISVHPRKYCIDEARADKNYGRHFTRGWETADFRRSQDFARIITNYVWSPIIFRHGHRLIENFVEARLLALDFDDPGYSLAEAQKGWCDTYHWIGTTKSHQRDKNGVICDRFRIIVPFSSVITDNELYTYNYRKALDLYPADRAAKDGGRLFFPCQEVVSTNLDGPYFQEIVAIPQEELQAKEKAAAYGASLRRASILPPWIRKHFINPIPHGKISHTIFGTSKDLAHYGFQAHQILALFLASPTFSERVVSADEYKRVVRHIRNGIRAAKKEASR